MSHGKVEVLPLGTTERECAERGERIYKLSEMGEVIEDLRAFKRTRMRKGLSSEELAEMVIDSALERERED